MPADPFGLLGHVIDGQFHALEVAGEGGFGVVYRGQHLSMREPIAIKCLKLKLKQRDEKVVASFTQRFFDESRIMYRLSQGNLNVARAITTGVTVAPTTSEPVPYMVLEWLDGVSLAKELKDRRAKKLPPPRVDEVIALFAPAADAIAYAHAQGVIHRDVKPGNLFLQNTRDGRRMKVLDFGMAKVLQPEQMGGLESAETLAGVTVLSPQYVAPEQLDRSLGAIGTWTDVYAFALIVLEALTNRRARDAENFAQLMAQIARSDQVPTPRKRGAIVSDAVERVFERALAREPTARPRDLGVFWKELTIATRQTDSDPPELATKVDLSLQTAFLGSTLVMGGNKTPTSQPKVDFGKTVPLSTKSPVGVPAVAPAPAPRPFAGTVPMPAADRPSGSALVPPARISAPAPLPPVSAPELEPEPAPPRRSRALVILLLLFALASIGASGFLLARLYLH